MPHPQANHFSACAAEYAQYRPRYPNELVGFLVRVSPRRELAWDCGCGSGQLSTLLAEKFDRVIATDSSREQLSHAAAHPRVEYRVGTAEASGLPDACVDLAVSAQAAHWFNLPAYYAEVRRASKPKALVALVTYGIQSVDARIDQVVGSFYKNVTDPFWSPERRHVENGYASLEFPFEELPAPRMEIGADWTLPQFAGYIETWSGLRAMEKAEGRARIDAFHRELASTWGAAETKRTIRWPLTVRCGRIS